MPSVLTTITSPALRKRLLDWGLGSRAYVPFVVLGRSRVGSNLLRGLLNAHPRVVAFGEIFQQAGSMDWDHTGYFRSRAMAAALDRDPAGFLDRRVFGAYPRAIQAAGFKLFYYHARDHRRAGVWARLEQRQEVRIIHLKRENILQTHLSRKRAAQTDRWVNTSGQAETAAVLDLDYDECLSDFVQTRTWEEQADRAFAAHRTLDVSYEQLAAGYQGEAKRIQAFLDLEPRAVAASTFQQARQPLHETIRNYADLKARFSGTPWEGFFTE
jgi:LPS sulfotransferase NodH